MTDYEAASIIGGWGEVTSEEDYLAAASHLVKTGLAWKLEGTVGHTVAGLIREGLIDPPEGGEDYWGNPLPTTREGWAR